MKIKRPLVMLFLVFPSFSFSSEKAHRPVHYAATELKPAAENADSLYFSRPCAIVYDEENLFILDSEDAEIKVFSKAGGFLHAFGKKGQGPGEFQTPGDMDILGDKIFVSDGANRRVQVLDKKGAYLGSFKVPFWPQGILALETEKILLWSLPSGFSGKEKVLHCFNSRGGLVWEAVDSYFSGDSVYDTMQNRAFLRKATKGAFFFIRSADDRIIRRMNEDGAVIKEIEISKGYPLKQIVLPLRGGRKKTLPVFCWNCAVAEGKIYLLIPEFTAGKDLGPGKRIAVIGEAGDIEAFIDCPSELTRIAVEGEKIYGLDSEARLRLFELKK